jgi:hypothetical protein
MSARDVLKTDIDLLVPPARSGSIKLPERKAAPNNTSSLVRSVVDIFGISQLSDKPEEIDQMIRNWRHK